MRSWSVSACGKPAAVAVKIQSDINAYKCIDPEESVKQAAGAAIAAALAAQPEGAHVQVIARGSQTADYENFLTIEVKPMFGFVE